MTPIQQQLTDLLERLGSETRVAAALAKRGHRIGQSTVNRIRNGQSDPRYSTVRAIEALHAELVTDAAA